MKIPINKQAEQKKREFDWSQQNFCTHILRKEKDVWQANREGKAAPGRGSLLKVGGWRVWFWVASRSPLLGGLGRTGRGHRSPWVDPAVLILSLLFWWLQDLREKRECVNVLWEYNACVCVCVWMITHLKRAHEWLIHTHHSTGVVKLPAVVWRWEQSDQLPLCKELITIFNHLRNTTHSLKLKHNLHIEDCLNHNNSKLTWIVDPDWLKWIGTWCALQIRSRSWRLRNLLTTSAPKVNETPRSFSPHPWTSLSGSDHSKSHSNPVRPRDREYVSEIIFHSFKMCWLFK